MEIRANMFYSNFQCIQWESEERFHLKYRHQFILIIWEPSHPHGHPLLLFYQLLSLSWVVFLVYSFKFEWLLMKCPLHFDLKLFIRWNGAMDVGWGMSDWDGNAIEQYNDEGQQIIGEIINHPIQGRGSGGLLLVQSYLDLQHNCNLPTDVNCECEYRILFSVHIL